MPAMIGCGMPAERRACQRQTRISAPKNGRKNSALHLTPQAMPNSTPETSSHHGTIRGILAVLVGS